MRYMLLKKGWFERDSNSHTEVINDSLSDGDSLVYLFQSTAAQICFHHYVPFCPVFSLSYPFSAYNLLLLNGGRPKICLRSPDLHSRILFSFILQIWPCEINVCNVVRRILDVESVTCFIVAALSFTYHQVRLHTSLSNELLCWVYFSTVRSRQHVHNV